MIGDGNNKDQLLIAVIEESIEFEILMDKTDFDSWLEGDSKETLKTFEQTVKPFIIYTVNVKKLEKICSKMKKKGICKNHKLNKSQIEKNITCQLFLSKNKRLDARISSEKEKEKEKYEEALYCLLCALNALKNPMGNNIDERWFVLLYNDLSICYAGLDNSSLSRGYAEEARRIIEKEESYKDFNKELSVDNSTNRKYIKNNDFVSSKLFELYTISLFNQALAEKRSQQYNEAERNFKKIIKYAEENTHLLNFNYYSAILNLSDLYIDLSRGREAIDLLNKVINDKKIVKDEDIRYWKAYLYETTALIDQSEYDMAEELLKTFKKGKSGFTLNKKHRVTSTGFKGLARYARCEIERVKNTLGNNEKSELIKAKKIIEASIEDIQERKQTGLETKAYKQLSDIYKILSQDEEDKDSSEYDVKVITCLIRFISEAEIKIGDLGEFISHEKRDYWIDKCDDLNALESFTGQIIKVTTDEPIDKYRDLLEKLKEKIKRECEDKNQLSRAKKTVTKIEKKLEEKKGIEYKECIFPEDSSRDEDNLTKKEIVTRLDINEKGFDSVLFERSNLKKDDHIVEMIVLRRWNSFSPGLHRESIGSLGGGYLLRINKTLLKKGDEEEDRGDNKIAENKVQMSEESSDKKKVEIENIVIDPGYNFLQNFRSEGFRVEDIDTIIVTHSHLDHCAELLPIMDLIFQINKRYDDYKKKKRKKKRVSLCLSKGAYKKFSSFTNEGWQDQLKDVIILENLDKKEWIPFKGKCLTISAIQTPHWDLGGVNAIGLMIEIDGIVGENEENSKTVHLGFTGDTPWYREIREDFGGCDLLCVHLGSIKYQEIGYTDDRHNLKSKEREITEGEKEEKFEETYTESNHLLFFGTEDIISHYNKTKKDSLYPLQINW